MQVVASAAMLALVGEVSQLAALTWLADVGMGVGNSIRVAASRRSRPLAAGCLAAIGILQAAASVPPLGDDIKFYSDFSDALLGGQAFANHAPGYVGTAEGIGLSYAPLPVFPLLLALSFKLVGRTLLGVALPTVIATAIFPLAFYAACKAITGSRVVAYATAILFFMFPVYQVHVLGAPEPDTVFITLLLFAAALAGKANGSPQRRYWIGMGLLLGLLSLTRHEGVAYAALVLFAFLVAHHSRPNYWLCVATLLALVAPFVVFLHSLSGAWWPASVGDSALSWENVDANLSNLRWASLPWYSQTVGVGPNILVGLLAATGLAVGLGTFAMSKRGIALVGIPVAGMSNIAMLLLMRPLLVYSLFPPDFLRHASYGIAYAAISLAYLGHVSIQFVSKRLPRLRPLILILVLLLTTWTLYYETERLARPEPFFDGHASLLWTGSYYLLTDVIERPVPIWSVDDPRPVSQVHADLERTLADVNLNRINRSEPYHWVSLGLALFGLAMLVVSPARWDVGRKPTVPDGQYRT